VTTVKGLKVRIGTSVYRFWQSRHGFFYQDVLFATKIEYVFDVIQSYFKYPMKA
jgi:hypothetical protein